MTVKIYTAWKLKERITTVKHNTEEEELQWISTEDNKIYFSHHPALITNSYFHPDTDLRKSLKHLSRSSALRSDLFILLSELPTPPP